MRFLSFGVCLRYGWARLAKPKAQLPEQSLALPHPQVDSILAFDPRRQRLSVPQVPAETRLSRHVAQNRVDLLELLFTQTPWPPGAFPLQQASQTHFFELVHPILDTSRRVTQQPGSFRARHALGHEQHAVKPMVIARFFRASDLILQSENNGGGVRDAEWSHSYMRSQIPIMRNYL